MENDQQHPSVSEAGSKVREDFDQFREAVQRETEQIRKTANQFIQEHPFYAVGAAFGVGFILSGGLFSKATARTLKFGTRFLMGRLIRNLIAGAGAGLMVPPEQH
jgi:hypothetical protein